MSVSQSLCVVCLQQTNSVAVFISVVLPHHHHLTELNTGPCLPQSTRSTVNMLEMLGRTKSIISSERVRLCWSDDTTPSSVPAWVGSGDSHLVGPKYTF